MPKRANTAPPPAPESAIDQGQIKRARRRAKRRADRFDAALRTIMATTEGAIVLWELLGRCGVNQTVMSRGIQEVLYMAGRQDVGHSILADMVRVDSDLYVDLERAMRTIDQREEQEEIAARTPSVTDNKGDED
jgi:hypothetical protein